MKTEILHAMKATAIPEGSSGRWTIHRLNAAKPICTVRDQKPYVLPAGVYTQLLCWTIEQIELRLSGAPAIGECVMEDSPPELQKHLQFALSAFGRVLVTGLGLGCVVRGLLANPKVKHVACIERDPDVLRLVQPHMPTDRLTIIVGDAVEWCANTDQTFDCAYHDIWSDPDTGEKDLQVNHMDMICTLRLKSVKLQAAWNFPRYFRKLMRTEGVI